MKKLMMVVALALVPTIWAAGTAKKNETPEEKAARKKAIQEAFLRESGGICVREGKGCVEFVNCQAKIGDDELQAAVNKFSHVLKYNSKIRKGVWTMDPAQPKDATFSVYLVDDKSMPMSLVAAESRWGVVNVATIKSGRQFSRELTRVLTLTIGGGISQVATSPMRPVYSPADLDKLITDGFTFDSVNSIFLAAKATGLTRSELATYREACTEGWAAQPTNDIQRAIWDEVRAIPDRPLEIKKKK